MAKVMDEDTKRVFLVVIENAIIINGMAGSESCLYCSWERAFIPLEEVKRLEKAPREEQNAWWAQVRAESQHDEECIVPLIRTWFGLPNPRAVYPDNEEVPHDHPQGQ